MSETFPDLLPVDEDRPHDRATGPGFVKPDTMAGFAEGLRPAFPVHAFLRSLAMSWASAVASYESVVGAASFWRSRRRTAMCALGLVRLSGRRPARTARRIVSVERPASRA